MPFYLCPLALLRLHIPFSSAALLSPKSHRAFKTPLCTASPKKPSRFLLGGSDRSVRSSLGTFLAFCSSFTGLITSFLVTWLFVYSFYLPHQSVSSSGEGTAGPGSPLNPSGADRPGRLHTVSVQAGSTELGNAPAAQFLTRNQLGIFPK